MRMRNNTSKIRWGLAGYVESRIYAWKPQASGCKGGTAQGKRPAHWEWGERENNEEVLPEFRHGDRDVIQALENYDMFCSWTDWLVATFYENFRVTAYKQRRVISRFMALTATLAEHHLKFGGGSEIWVLIWSWPCMLVTPVRPSRDDAEQPAQHNSPQFIGIARLWLWMQCACCLLLHFVFQPTM